MDAQKKELLQRIDRREDFFTDLADRIWDCAETRFDLRQSADLLCDALEKGGFTVERGVADMPHAFVATYGSGEPVVGILAEYDALSGSSQVCGAFEQRPLEGVTNGHGCGHHILGAGALAAAVGLADLMESDRSLHGTIKYFGCPAEESGSGKAFMARAGIFDNLDAAFTWHPMTETRVFGTSSLANYQIYFRFRGTTAHAAFAPHRGRSALDACELMNVGANYLREHVIPEARIHYAYVDVGGAAPNVVQSSAGLLYFIRAPKSHQVKEIFERIEKIAQGAALMTGTELSVEWDSACAEIVVNDTLSRVIYDNAAQIGPSAYTDEEIQTARRYTETLGESERAALRAAIKAGFEDIGEERLQELANKPVLFDLLPYKITDAAMPGSTDVGDASWNAPLAQVTCACFPNGTVPHTWQWVASGKSGVAHKGAIQAAKIMAASALDVLKDPDIARRAREEWLKRLDGRSYECAIPKDVLPR